MADLSLAQLATRLKTVIRDVPLTTWTSDEIDEALEQAVENDHYVAIRTRDDSLVTEANKTSYDLPENFLSLDRLEIDYDESGFNYPLDRTGWEMDDTTIYLTRGLKGLPAGKTLVCWGLKKLTSTDLIPPRYQNYVLHLAAISLLENLMFSKTGKFLKNDTTMSEIIQAIEYNAKRVAELQRQFANRNETEL